MKIHVAKIKAGGSGRRKFFDALSRELTNLGEKVTREPGEVCDISLQAIYIKPTKAKYSILRLDGVYHNTLVNYKAINTKIVKEGVKRADAIVYQSNFSKKLCDVYLGKFSGRTLVIHNGANPEFYKKTVSASVDCKHVVLAVANWRPHKRLWDTIESFLLADVKDSVLFIIGNVSNSGVEKKKLEKYFKLSNVRYLGRKTPKDIASYLKTAEVFIHLCWIDNCPNGVVEAIVAKVPVITNNVGGTQELVEPSGGIVLPLDKEYDMKPCNLYNPPKINRNLVAKAVRKCCSEKIEITNSHVAIHNIALQYREFFRKVIND